MGPNLSLPTAAPRHAMPVTGSSPDTESGVAARGTQLPLLFTTSTLVTPVNSCRYVQIPSVFTRLFNIRPGLRELQLSVMVSCEKTVFK